MKGSCWILGCREPTIVGRQWYQSVWRAVGASPAHAIPARATGACPWRVERRRRRHSVRITATAEAYCTRKALNTQTLSPHLPPSSGHTTSSPYTSHTPLTPPAHPTTAARYPCSTLPCNTPPPCPKSTWPKRAYSNGRATPTSPRSPWSRRATWTGRIGTLTAKRPSTGCAPAASTRAKSCKGCLRKRI